jgi:transposase-like protein
MTPPATPERYQYQRFSTEMLSHGVCLYSRFYLSYREAFLTMNGERHYLWRAVEQDGKVLDLLVQSRRNKKATKQCFRQLLKGLTYVPRVIITDKLKS